MTTTETSMSTAEALIKDIAAIYNADNDNEHALAKAKSKHEKSSDNSIRALSARLSSINEDLDAATVDTIAESVAAKLAKGSKSVLKARKSELKLAVPELVVAARQLRRATLRALRASAMADAPLPKMEVETLENQAAAPSVTPAPMAAPAEGAAAAAVLPLNLWYCHAQGLLTLDQGLWVASLVCVLLFEKKIATFLAGVMRSSP